MDFTITLLLLIMEVGVGMVLQLLLSFMIHLKDHLTQMHLTLDRKKEEDGFPTQLTLMQ